MSEKQQQQEQQQRQDSVQSDAFDDDYGDDPDDFVANQKPSGRGTNTNTKNKQGSIYSSKHSRIKQAQRESRSNAKPAPKAKK